MGGVRLIGEAGLTRDLRASGLIGPRLDIDSRERIGQTSSVVALGGLRTLVATMLNLRAYTAFSERRWGDVAETFETMVHLAPRTRYYWETGAWHLAYNAASYYLNDSTLPALRRREAWRSYIVKGRAFIERGIHNNPGDWSLLANLGFILSDPNKYPAFRDNGASFGAAARAYEQAAQTGKAPAYIRRAWFYALARVEGRESEALALGRSLDAEGQKNRTPTMRMLLLVLEAHENPSLDVAARACELFSTPAQAYAALSTHWQRTRERFPVFGVSRALESLEKMLSISAEESILRRALPPPTTPDDWFRP